MSEALPSWREAFGRATRPPIGDRRFWVVQALILGVVLGHLSLDLSRVRLPLGMPVFTTVGFFLVPIIYAALSGAVGRTRIHSTTRQRAVRGGKGLRAYPPWRYTS